MYEPSFYDDFYNIDIDAAAKQKCLTVKRTYHLNTALTIHVKTTPQTARLYPVLNLQPIVMGIVACSFIFGWER